MNGVEGGPAGKALVLITNGNGTCNVMLAWDHGGIPACGMGIPSVPAKPYQNPTDPIHYPIWRHLGVWMVAYCDGSVRGMRQDELTDPLFYIDGP